MKLAIMQPYTFPFIGYFQLINAVDKFIFYDDVNYIKKGFINRNSILYNNKKYRFTIPCKSISQNKLINEIELDFNTRDRKKFNKTIYMAYKKAPFFNDFYPFLENFISNDIHRTISDFSIDSTKFICNYLGLNKKFMISSNKYENTKKFSKENRLIEITISEHANFYINSIGGKELYNKKTFFDKNIKLMFLKPNIISYKQSIDKFVPNLSIIDVIMYNQKKDIKIMLNKYELI